MVATKSNKHVSFTSFAKGMVITEADVEIVGSNFELWNYGGKRSEDSPALHIALKNEAGDIFDQLYSVGKIEDFVPTKDGKSLDILSNREKIHEQTNFAIFMEALFGAGYPRAAINNDDIGCLVGVKGHVVQKSVKRTGANVQSETNVLVFDKVGTLPEEGADSGAGDEIRSTADSLVLEIISEAGGSVERKKILGAVIKSDTYKDLDKGDKSVLLNLIKSDAYMLDSDAAWSVDKGVVSV